MRRSVLLSLLVWFLATTGIYAEGAAFDLAGPKVDVHVKRGDVTLPISETPNLLPGDRLWIHPDLAVNQSKRFILVVAFLRGATNPPPANWFTSVDTWNPTVRSEGFFVTVPAQAQQALIFLAPATGGDFKTLRHTVREMPGSFVRAAQDLQAASGERMRLDAYLKEVKVTSQSNSKTLQERAEMAARSLGIKINESCFDKPADQQVACLSQNSEGLVLDDSNAQSLVTQLANGSALNIVNQLSYSNMAGGGVYSPYIGAIVDTAMILSNLRTAHFQYIPALALPTADTLNLRLNMPISFRNPKSVVVVALPPLGPAHPEPLHPVDPASEFCAQKPGLILPAEGAPLAFATHLAHNLVLHLESEDDANSPPVDLPVIADPAKGGLVLDHPVPPLPPGQLTGVIEGRWGFDNWHGPHFLLRGSQPGGWVLTSGSKSALVVGRSDTVTLVGQDTLCVDKIQVQAKGGDPMNLTWKSPTPTSLEVTVPMKNASPGPVTLSIYQYGQTGPERIAARAYADAASLDHFILSKGDNFAFLLGTRLDEVAKAQFDGIAWTPGVLTRVKNRDQLTLNTAASTAKLKPGKRYMANVRLLDGRKLRVRVTVDPPRPEAVLLSKGVQATDSSQPPPVAFGSPDDLPVNDKLVFFLKATTPDTFSRDEKVEVAAGDLSFRTTLTLSNGSLMLENASTAVGSLEPLKSFGSSAFGPVRVRLVAPDGAAGDWLPLGTLVRLPEFKDLRCSRFLDQPCVLSGSNLFLAASFSSSPEFDNPTSVPLDFTGTEIAVPRPADGVLYMKLRDDLATVQTLHLPVTLFPPLRRHAAVHRKPASAATPAAATTAAGAAAATPASGTSATSAGQPSTGQAAATHPAVGQQPAGQPLTKAVKPEAPASTATPAKPTPAPASMPGQSKPRAAASPAVTPTAPAAGAAATKPAPKTPAGAEGGASTAIPAAKTQPK